MANKYQTAIDEGYSHEEIMKFLQPKIDTAISSGYSQQEVNEYLGLPGQVRPERMKPTPRPAQPKMVDFSQPIDNTQTTLEDREAPKQLQDLGKIYSMPKGGKTETPTADEVKMYAPARVFSALIEKPAYAMTELSTRLARTLTPKDSKAYNYLSGLVDYYNKPEKYGVATPTAEKVRSYFREQNYQTNTAMGIVGDITDAGTDLMALMVQMGVIGKPDTNSPLLTKPMTALRKHATKMGIHGLLTTKGDAKDRIQSAVYRIGYNITPYIAKATGARGITATAIDTALNTFLTSPTYVDAYKQAGGINEEFLSMAIPQFVMDVGMALSTGKRTKSEREKVQLEKYRKERMKELGLSKKEFNKLITEIQKV